MIYLLWTIVCIWGALMDIITDRGNRPDWIVKYKDVIWLIGLPVVVWLVALLGTCGYSSLEFTIRSIPVGLGCSIIFDSIYGWIKSKDIFAPAPTWLNAPFLKIEINTREQMKRFHAVRILVLVMTILIK